jgi:hypothetical protein
MTSVLNRQMVKFFTMTRTFDVSKAQKRLEYMSQASVEGGREGGKEGLRLGCEGIGVVEEGGMTD